MTKEEFKKWCTKNRSSCFESNIKSKFPDIHAHIISYTMFPEDFKFSQKMYHYLNNDPDLMLGICPICGNRCKFKQFTTGYTMSCSKECSDVIKSRSISKTKAKRTADEKDESCRKRRETCLKKYGVDSFSKTEMFRNQYTHEKLQEINNKVQRSNIDRYGCRYYSQTDEFKHRVTETNNNKSCEEKRSRVEKIQESRNKWTPEQKQLNSQHISEGQINMSLDDKLNKVNKFKETNLQRYGDASFTRTQLYIDKTIETNQSKYGVDWCLQSDLIKEKAKNTCLEKYGVECYAQSGEFKDRYKDADYIERLKTVNNENFGSDWYFQSDEFKKRFENYEWVKSIVEKRYNTKKKNNTFNTSKIEDQLKEYFDSNNINYISQYKSDLYPFNCDFYFPDKDLYVEIQGSWTHGTHPFTGTEEDLNTLNLWESKQTKYYENAIEVWTIRDVKKRETAKKNKLNWIEIFSCDLETCTSVILDELV